MPIKRPTLGKYETAYDGRMKPLKDYEVENRQRMQREEPAASIDAKAVRRVFRKHAPDQWQHMDRAHHEGRTPTGRVGNPDTDAVRFANQFGRHETGYVPGDGETIVNTPEAVERAQRVVEIIRNQKMTELVDNAVGYSQEVIETYRDLEFEVEVQRNRDLEVSEQDIWMEVNHDSADYDLSRIGWQEHFRNGDGSHQFHDPEEVARQSIRNGTFDADAFAENLAQQYEAVVPDIEDQYRAQNLVNAFANNFVNHYIAKTQAKVAAREVFLMKDILNAQKVGDIKAAATAQAKIDRLLVGLQQRISNAREWRGKILNGTLKNPAKAIDDIIRFADKWGGMNDAQGDIARQMRDRLAHQQQASAQNMLRRQVALKQILETAGRQKPDWLGDMIARTQYAAEQEAQAHARRLQAAKKNKQGDNPRRPRFHGQLPPSLQPLKKILAPPADKPAKKKGWFRR